MPLPVNTPSVNTITRRAIKRVGKQSTGKEPLSSLTVGCLTGDLYDLLNSVTLLITIKQASQQTFEDDLKRLADLLTYMKPPITLIFQAGGTLRLPVGFQRSCTALGVVVTIVESEDQLFGVLRHLNDMPELAKAPFDRIKRQSKIASGCWRVGGKRAFAVESHACQGYCTAVLFQRCWNSLPLLC